MKSSVTPPPKATRSWFDLAGRIVLLGVSLGLSVLAMECLLHTVPTAVPRGVFYGSGSYDPALGFKLPNSSVIYNKVRYVERKPNLDGFMDVDHVQTKPAGVVRVGFFGDSYVEAVQVPLEDVFFRRLPDTVGGDSLEAFGFGLSGLGTLHSMLLYRKFGGFYDLDLIVYVFVDNDPGDHLAAAQRLRRGLYAARPTVVPSQAGVGYEVLPGPTPQTASPLHWLAAVVKDHSLFARALYARIQLLSRRGLGAPQAFKTQDPPSTWPPELRAEAEVVTRRLLRQWAAEVRAGGQEFLVFYVPRKDELTADQGDGSWRGWLHRTCGDLGIDLVDPTSALAAAKRRGDAMYNDHWTPAGHRVVAEVLTEVLQARLGRTP